MASEDSPTDLSEEIEQFRGALRRFVDDELIPLEQQERPDGTIPDEATASIERHARQLGFWAGAVPTELGGAGLSAVALTVVAEELSRSTLWEHAMYLGTPLLPLLLGTDDQLRRYVAPTVQGDRIGALALTEVSGGSDPAGNIRTRARQVGSRWIVDGHKVFVSRGAIADHFVVFARTDPHAGAHGITAFVIDRDTEGLEHVRTIPTMGSQMPSEITFDGCEIGDEQRLGEIGGGFVVAQETLGRARAWIGAHTLGVGRRLLELVVPHVSSRSSFGTTIAQHGMAQAHLADCSIELEACRWMTYHAAAEVDRHHDTRVLDAKLKVFASEVLGRVADRVLQLCGGWGYSKDLPIERMFRDARMWRIVEGPNDVHRRSIARDLLRGAPDTPSPVANIVETGGTR